MAYSDTVKMVTGDTLPQLNFTLKDSSTAVTGSNLDEYDSDTWAALDLTNSSVSLRIRSVGSSTIIKTIACDIVDADAGKVRASFVDNAFTEAGTYEGELEITFSGGGKQTVHDLVKFKVRSDFD